MMRHTKAYGSRREGRALREDGGLALWASRQRGRADKKEVVGEVAAVRDGRPDSSSK